FLKKLVLTAAGGSFVFGPVTPGLLTAAQVQPSIRSDWETAAGGKLSFEVASVKPSVPGTPPIRPNFPLSADDAYQMPDGTRPTDGRLRADFTLITYITFAFKVSLSPDERETLLSRLPKWVANDKFTIEAKAPNSN